MWGLFGFQLDLRKHFLYGKSITPPMKWNIQGEVRIGTVQDLFGIHIESYSEKDRDWRYIGRVRYNGEAHKNMKGLAEGKSIGSVLAKVSTNKVSTAEGIIA